MTDTKETLGANLQAARQAAGNPSYDTLAREMYRDIGIAPNAQTFRQYHRGAVSLDRINLDVIAWLAVRYDISVYELSPSLAPSVMALKGLLVRTRWSVLGVENPPDMQGVLALDFGDFHARPVAVPDPTPVIVLCRCGDAHELKSETAACVYCATPTFDEHRVCAQCRDLEALEEHAGSIIDLVAAHSQAG